MTTTDPTRRVVPTAEAIGGIASLLSLLSGPRSSADLRQVALALRDLAGALDHIAARRETPYAGGFYDSGWVSYRGA